MLKDLDKIVDSKSYEGPFFLLIPTDYVFLDLKVTDKINSYSKGIIHDLSKPNFTQWELNNFSAGLKVVLLMQEKKYPFRLEGKDGILFMEVSE